MDNGYGKTVQRLASRFIKIGDGLSCFADAFFDAMEEMIDERIELMYDLYDMLCSLLRW